MGPLRGCFVLSSTGAPPVPFTVFDGFDCSWGATHTLICFRLIFSRCLVVGKSLATVHCYF